MLTIHYQSGYKYQLKREYAFGCGIKPTEAISTDYIDMHVNGYLIVRKGYAWDGPSGPTLDTLNFMRGSLVHDALYQLMREGHLDFRAYRNQADKLLARLCREDGMSAMRAWSVYHAVRLFADPAADPAHNKPVKTAP